MPHLNYSDAAKQQLEEIPVLADIKRNVNLGDLLTFNKSNKPIFGIFNGFIERGKQIYIELCNGLSTQYVHPKEIVTLHAGSGYINVYYNRGKQGCASGRLSI